MKTNNTNLTRSPFKRCYICHRLLTAENCEADSPVCKTCKALVQPKVDTLIKSSSVLKGRVALVTGGRIKIGFQASLALLRKGAEVIITTRFPVDAVKRYEKENDYETWADRLYIYGIDFRDIREVEIMIKWLYDNFKYLDILINNAAQTIARPEHYYTYLKNMEKNEAFMLPDKDKKRIVSPHESVIHKSNGNNKITRLVPDNITLDSEGFLFDSRPSNSWITRTWDVSTKEMLEVQLVNVTAPFLLCSKLVQLMKKSPNCHKFIVNVSSMEGKFSKHNKNGYHPHTNMAKAALNMLTRTAAKDYETMDIYMNSVDTGWITDENPNWLKKRNQQNNIIPPLSCEEGAARVCDPILSCLENKEKPFSGKFLKDFKETNW